MQRTCFTVFDALTRVFASVSVFCNKRAYVPVSSKRGVGGAEHGFARNLYVDASFCSRCSFRFERIGAARETEGNTDATRCQPSHRSRRILGDTSPRENDDYVRGSTRRFYTFPLNQPLTSLRMHRALRSTIDKRSREASQFDGRDSFVDVERKSERGRFRDVRDGEDVRARNGWEKYVRILARSAP